MAELQLKPVVALVGRTNVGKSTLFNRLTRSRAALVANVSGLTRDRQYGEGRLGPGPYIVVDTGGFEPVETRGILVEMARQTQQAIQEADVVIFLVDGRDGLNAHDHEIARLLRRTGRPVLLAINKAEGMRNHASLAQFHELGFAQTHLISAAHGDGVAELMHAALGKLGRQAVAPSAQDDDDSDAHRIRLAVAGRPNVGKSTFINTLLGHERLVTYNEPGTTRDAIEIEFERAGRPYVLIDTAGLRRRGRVFETVEKFSVIKTLQAIEAANVVLLMLDAEQGISDQDAHIAGFILDAGRALVVGLNKWDAIDADQQAWVQREYQRKLRFLSFARCLHMSALTRQGIGPVLEAVESAHAAAYLSMSTARLTRVLQESIEQQQPPIRGKIRPKLRYAHQGGRNPPRIIIHGNALHAVPDSYRRYLESRFRQAFGLDGTPVSVEFRSSQNPYARDE